MRSSFAASRCGPPPRPSCWPAPLRAASPRDELLRFVPEDVGFCFVMQDLRAHAADLADSPFVEQIRQSPIGVALRGSQELKQLDRVDKTLRQQLGVGWDRLRDDVFGDAIVFAYRPGPPGKPDQEQGLILVRARTAEALARLVENLNKAQKKDGALTELEERSYKGATYFRRVEPGRTNYYYIRDAVLLFTGQEDVLRRALDVDRQAAADSEPPLARRLREVGAGRAALALWLNPRAFDAGLEDKAARAEGANAVLQKKVLDWWKAADGLAAWVTLDTEFHLSVAGQVRIEKLPASVRRLLTAASRPSDMWRYFPDDALLACGGRLDAAALVEALQDLQPGNDAGAAANSAFGKDFVKDVLSRLGPDWGLCVTAPPADGTGGATPSLLPQVFLAVRAAPGDETAPVDQALLSAVHTAALLGVLGYNHGHPAAPLRLKSAEFGTQEIHYITGGDVLPPGVQPAYGLTNGWMAFGSSPDVIRRFAEASPKPAPADGGFPLLRVSLKGWRAYLKDRRQPLATLLAEKNGLTVEETRKRLDDLIGALEFVDRLEVDCRTNPGQTVVTLTIQTAQPLNK